MKKILIPFLLLVVLMNACKKDETTTPAKPSETPVSSLVSDTDWKLTAYTANNYELGYVFSATSAGKLTQLGVQMAEPGIYTVSIWDGNSKALLRQKAVEQTSPTKFSTAILEELSIEKDKKYVVSINSVVGGVKKKYNGLAKTGSTSTIFPISRGSIIIQKSVFAVSAVPVFPATDYSTSNTFWGFVDITFIPN